MRGIPVVNSAGLVLMGLLSLTGGCISGDDVAFESAEVHLEGVYSLPSGTITRTTETEFEIELENLEELEHDFYYVVWLKDTDPSNSNPWIPMAQLSFEEGGGTAALHQEDIVGEDFTTLDQVLVSVEEDGDESGIPDVLDNDRAGVPSVTGPEVTILFSEDFSDEGGVRTVLNEHFLFGDGLSGMDLDRHAFEESMGEGSPGSSTEVHVNYIQHEAFVEVKDTPQAPPGFHYALWGLSADGSVTVELADVELEDELTIRDGRNVGSSELSASLTSFDLFSGMTFQITLENTEGEPTISPVIIHSGELACAPGYCAGGEVPESEPPPEEDDHAH